MRKVILLLVSLLLLSCSTEEQYTDCYDYAHAWEDGVIPFYFNENTPEYHRDLFYQAIDIYMKETPVTFVEYTGDSFFQLPHGVLIKNTGAVNSGYYPYGQGEYITDLRLGGERFLDLSTMLHELGHVVGLPHEHQRADRDEYVDINWDGIPEEWHGNFKLSTIDFETTYDPYSIMGYPSSDFDIKMKDGTLIVPSDFLTELDIKKIEELYCN